MPQVVKKKDRRANAQMTDDEVKTTSASATPLAAPKAPDEVKAPNVAIEADTRGDAAERKVATQPSVSASPQADTTYPYHDALACFPVGQEADDARAVNANIKAEQVIEGLLSKEFSMAEEVSEVVGGPVHGEFIAMSAAAALVGEKIPGLEHLEFPPQPQGVLDTDPGLAELEGILSRAKPTFADGVDEFQLDIQLNQTKEGDI